MVYCFARRITHSGEAQCLLSSFLVQRRLCWCSARRHRRRRRWSRNPATAPFSILTPIARTRDRAIPIPIQTSPAVPDRMLKHGRAVKPLASHRGTYDGVARNRILRSAMGSETRLWSGFAIEHHLRANASAAFVAREHRFTPCYPGAGSSSRSLTSRRRQLELKDGRAEHRIARDCTPGPSALPSATYTANELNRHSALQYSANTVHSLAAMW
jgi:hypothetical protein